MHPNQSHNLEKSRRKAAVFVGTSLLVMAVLAGIAIPSIGTLMSRIGLLGVFVLDIIVSLGIYIYYKKSNPNLAMMTSAIRLIYTSILGVAIAYLFAGDVPMFNKLFGIGLITFGFHLIALGVLFNNESGKKWVNGLMKFLLIIAGIAYIIQHAGSLVVTNPIEFSALIQSIFILPMILAEVGYALWMIIKGGKAKG